MQATRETNHLPISGTSCNKCSHMKVCAVYRAIKPLLEKSWTPETRPFEGEEIAVICKEFLSNSITDAFKEQT